MTTLPRLYARWLDEAGVRGLDGEPSATCEACPLCASGELSLATKCCTRTPALVNFLLGRILARAEGDPGRARLEAHVLARGWGTPLGLPAPAGTARAKPRLGRKGAAPCAFYDPAAPPRAGSCTIWSDREAGCSTWFCRHERGALGFASWRALERLLAFVEVRLALAAARVVTGDPDHDCDHADDPRAFFLACAAWVEGLSFAELRAQLGPGLDEQLDALRQARATEQAPAPSRLRPGQLQILDHDEESVRLWSYSRHEPVELPARLVELLDAFDGRPTAEVLAAIEREAGVELDARLAQLLFEQGILVDAGS